MNKILIDRDKLSITKDSIIEYLVNKVNLDINDNCVIHDETNKINKDIQINISDNKKLIYYKKNIFDDLNMYVQLNNNCTFELNISSSIKNSVKINVIVDIVGNNNKAFTKIRIISEDNGSSTIKVDGNVMENTSENELNEDVRIMQLNDLRNEIIPNMRIYTSNVIANHNAVISGINKDYLFYLKSKGIDDILSIEILKNSFLNIKEV